MSQFTYFNLKLSSASDDTVHVTEIKSNVQDWSWEKTKTETYFGLSIRVLGFKVTICLLQPP